MICEVYQWTDRAPGSLLLVAGGREVINGAWYIADDDGKLYDYPIELLGLIDWPWVSECQNEDYNITLQRFENGERAQFVVCSCCDVGGWRNEKGEKINKPNPEDYPRNNDE